MSNIEIIIILLSIISLLVVVAGKVKIPYPILLVLAGLGIGFIPHLPKVELNPDLVFLIFLPPLLYASAWTTSWHDFTAAHRPIALLAIGLVLFTTTIVAIVAHTFIPGFSWPVAFLLGSIISPPDAVAAASITKGLGLPKRIVTILEGESLVNDASGLIAYRYAITAVMTGNFVLWQAGFQFLIVASIGILVGYLVGLALFWIHKHVHNPIVETSLTFLTPFIAYLIAEHIHVSGVLAVVTCGLYLSWRSSELFSSDTRLQTLSVWNVVVFILNGIIFIIIGLQLPGILEGTKEHSLVTLLGYGLLISFTAIIVRILWVFPGAYIPRFSSKIRKAEPQTNWKVVSIVAWTGMRGVVSLAAALAIPVMMNEQTAFPQRDLILFLTFSVILVTLIFQGLTLPTMIKLLGIRSNGQEVENEVRARIRLASAAIEYIEENISYGMVTDQVLAQIKNKYEIRINHLSKFLKEEEEGFEDDSFDQFHKLQRELLKIERSILADMHKKGATDEEILRKLEYELDLEESRLGMEKGGESIL
jgi:CPA1 family monovalent cation:H+ antiporter